MSNHVKIADLKHYVKKEKVTNPTIPLFVPMDQAGDMLEGGKKVPVHTAHTYTRGDKMEELVVDPGRTGGLASGYIGYFYAIVSFILVVLTYNVSLYLAAVFAYAFGYYWSQRMLAPFWNITWFKGKMLYYTK